MGRWGRSFVATAPTRAEIAEFAGPAALDPIRVYVGRRAGDTPRERAELALAELIRVGGFERSALVVVVPVGTGWMDPGAHDTLDFMLGGDVATVAVQYSYLTSVLSLMAHPAYGVEQARELFNLVYAHWSALPRGDAAEALRARPEPGRVQQPGDAAAARHARRPDRRRDVGGLAVLQRLLALRAREPGQGQPGLAAALRQRLAGAHDQPVRRSSAATAPWGPTRLVFLNYGSDPIVVFNPASAWFPPDWMAPPRAPDVAPELRWFPVVTTFQLGARHGEFAGGAAATATPTSRPTTSTPGRRRSTRRAGDPTRAEALKAIFATRPGPFD